jgi:hypothetical protein
MALPTRTAIVAMDYAFLGVPFVDVTTKTSVDLLTMDYGFLGVPFVTATFSEPTLGPQSGFIIFQDPGIL